MIQTYSYIVCFKLCILTNIYTGTIFLGLVIIDRTCFSFSLLHLYGAVKQTDAAAVAALCFVLTDLRVSDRKFIIRCKKARGS